MIKRCKCDKSGTPKKLNATAVDAIREQSEGETRQRSKGLGCIYLDRVSTSRKNLIRSPSAAATAPSAERWDRSGVLLHAFELSSGATCPLAGGVVVAVAMQLSAWRWVEKSCRAGGFADISDAERVWRRRVRQIQLGPAPRARHATSDANSLSSVAN